MRQVPWRLCLLIAWLVVAAYASLYTVGALTLQPPSPEFDGSASALTRTMGTLSVGTWSFVLTAVVVASMRPGLRQVLAGITADTASRRPLSLLAFAVLGVVLGFTIAYGLAVIISNVIYPLVWH